MNSIATNQRSQVGGSAQSASALVHASPDELEDFAAESGMLTSIREMPAWAVSLAVHLLVLFGLWNITQISLPEQQLLINSVMEEVDQEALKFDNAVQTDQIGTDSNTPILGPSQAVATVVNQDRQEEVRKKLAEQFIKLNVPNVAMVPQVAAEQLMERYDSQGATEHPGGTEGAIDRLAFEITNSLSENKTLAIWLFDASLSLKKRRDLIADRFENVYAQIDKLNPGADRALKTAVASFGERTQIITPEPIDDVSEVVDSIRNIAPDKSGKEHVFAAVKTVANKWLSYRTKMRRNVMIIIITDERGDDYEMVEQVAGDLARYGIRVFCVGNASIFGREKGYVEWVYEDGFKQDIPVDQGPESVMAERLNLPFWGGGNDNRKYERLSAGYGPYALTRLCAETGGVFFVADESSTHFDPNIMRNYQPDYRPIRDYWKDVNANAAKLALVEVCRDFSEPKLLPRLQLRFRADNDNVLRTEITEAQRPAAVFDHTLNAMLAELSKGEKAREDITEPRWRASYDLAVGRVLAMRVRAFGYNKMLAEMKRVPKTFENKKNNSWRLEPSRDITAGPDVRTLAKEANKYLKRVIDEHSGTPWAMLASREITQAMGWKWVEESVIIPGVTTRIGPDGKPMLVLADDEQKKRDAKKKKVRRRVPPQL